MKKLVLIMVFLILLTLYGCSQAEYKSLDLNDNESSNVLLEEVTSERKIIYDVDMRAHVSHIDQALSTLKSWMNEDEWLDQETIVDKSAHLTIRIKSDRLETFIDHMKAEFTLDTYSKSATDISLSYQDKTLQLIAIDAQIARLVDLYDQASLSDMLIINQQLSYLEVERRELQGDINQFDRLSDYSTINLSLYTSAEQAQSSFIQRLQQSISNGFSGLVQFVQGFILIIATMLPFLTLFGVLGGLVLIFIKRKNKKFDHLKKKTT